VSKHTQKKRKLLEGHKKVGSRFIPPMKQIPNMKSTSFVNQMLPELIWIGLVNDNIGYVKGARFVEKIFIAANEIAAGETKENFAYASSYGMLDDSNKLALIDKLAPLGILDDLKNYLAPLVLLYYDEFPMRFIGPPSTVISNEQLVRRISLCVEKHLDKYETPGIVLNGSVFLYRLVTKTISFSADMKLPNFNAVIDAPESDEAKRAAGFMRANAIGEFGTLGISDRWARYFWNRGYELSPCTLHAEAEDGE
jgi:hypothetical protein